MAGKGTQLDFRAQVKPSFDTRDTIAGLDHQVTAAIDQREDADAETSRLSALVVNSLKGDPWGSRFGVRWQSAAATPLLSGHTRLQSGVALRFPPHSKSPLPQTSPANSGCLGDVIGAAIAIAKAAVAAYKRSP